MNPLSSASWRILDAALSRECLNILEIGSLLTHVFLQNDSFLVFCGCTLYGNILLYQVLILKLTTLSLLCACQVWCSGSSTLIAVALLAC